MSSRVGTSYFVSRQRAAAYYAQYDPYLAPELIFAWVDEKIVVGEINIGKPPAIMGKVIGVNADGRYEIETGN